MSTDADPVVVMHLSLTNLRDIAKALGHRLEALADAGTYRGHPLRPAVAHTRERVAELAAEVDRQIKLLESK